VRKRSSVMRQCSAYILEEPIDGVLDVFDDGASDLGVGVEVLSRAEQVYGVEVGVRGGET